MLNVMSHKAVNYKEFSEFSVIWDKFIYDTYFLETSDIKELLNQFGLSKVPTYVMCISLDHCCYSVLDTSCYKVYLILHKILRNLLPKKCEFLLLFAHQNCFYLSGHLLDFSKEKRVNYKVILKEIAGKVIEQLKEKLELFGCPSVTIGIDFGNAVSLRDWREIAQHAIVAHRQKVFYGEGNIFWWEPSIIKRNSSSINELFPTIGSFRDLLNSIIERKLSDIDSILSDLIEDIFRRNLGRLLYLRIQLIEGIILVAHTAIGIGASDIEVSRIVLDFIEKINQIYDPVDLFTITHQAFRSLINLIKTIPMVTDPVISIVLEKITNTEDLSSISLREISQEIPIDYFWLSRVFKKRLGISFTEYLNREKCSRAKKLLLYTHKNISEVAFAAGFKSVQYFEKVFKKLTGISPNKFRLEYSKSYSMKEEMNLGGVSYKR